MFESLRQIPALDGVPDEQLLNMCGVGQQLDLNPGDVLMHEGDPPQGLFVMLEGSLEVTKQVGGKTVVLVNHHKPGTFVGEISLLTNAPHTATVHATEPTRVIKFDSELFNELKASPIVGLLLTTMSQRLRETEQLVQQHEKLSALGKISAGLAHELNNPAAANLRAGKQLPEALATLQSVALKLRKLNLTDAQFAFLDDLQARVLTNALQPSALSPLMRSDLEEQVAEWIDAHNVENAWQMAPMLVTAGIDIEQLEDIRAHLGEGEFADALTWAEAFATVISVSNTIVMSSNRISELIKAVKSYSYMDQTPIQEVDIHEGIENTLIILGHKLKDITVKREYTENLPRITVLGSELNQVWTNLIDNAIDAMGGKGQITISTWRENERIKVEIADSGPGIPPDVQSRIFEPFYTTKGVGKGSGLGLDIAYRITVDRHHGDIRVYSEPGDTRFQVCLPIGQKPG